MINSGFVFWPLLVCLLTLATAALSAQKVERERGLSPAAVPAAVLNYLDSSFAARRQVQYYEDIGEGGTTIEVKFRQGDERYSIEFSPEGTWLDTEREVAIDAVPKTVWAGACADFETRFERFRVLRVQDHRGRNGDQYYEVEVRGRQDFEWLAYQYRLSTDGSILEAKEIELSPGHLDQW